MKEMKHTSMMTPRRGIIAATAITMALIALMFLATPDIRASGEESETSCLEGGYNPTPTAVEITAVPISVASTTNEYFVLYADHDLEVWPESGVSRVATILGFNKRSEG